MLLYVAIKSQDEQDQLVRRLKLNGYGLKFLIWSFINGVKIFYCPFFFTRETHSLLLIVCHTWINSRGNSLANLINQFGCVAEFNLF